MKKSLVLAVVVLAGLTVSTQQAMALDVTKVEIVCGADRTNGTITEWTFAINMEGTGMTDGVFWNSYLSGSGTEWKALTLDVSSGDLWYAETFVSQAAMVAKYPDTNSYHLYVNYAGPNPLDYQDQVLLGFAAAAPTGYATITNPLHGATGVALDPLYQWNDVSGVCSALGLQLSDGSDDTVYDLIPEQDETRTTWQPGPLAPNSPYSIMVATANLTAGDNQITTMLSGDPFEVMRANVDINANSFRTGIGEVPEPATWAIFGTALVALVGWRRRTRMS